MKSVGVVAVVGDNVSIRYARWCLEQVGCEIEPNPTDSFAGPWLLAGVSGDDGAASADPGGRHLVRLWDFQVGRAGSGIHASAASGVSWVIGWPGKSPQPLPVRIPEKWCGLLGASLALSGFLAQPSPDGRADVFDVAAADILYTFASQNFGNHSQIPDGWRRNGRVAPEHGGIYPQGYFECKDGYVGVVARSRRDWELILLALGDPAWAVEELRNPVQLAEDTSVIDDLFTAELRKFTRQELLDVALKYAATVAPVFTPQEAIDRGIARPGFLTEDGLPGMPFTTVAAAGR